MPGQRARIYINSSSLPGNVTWARRGSVPVGAVGAARTIDAIPVTPRGSGVVLRTIPSTDRGFATSVSLLARDHPFHSASELEATLRDLYPRVVVRDRMIAGERHRTLYVYRDGHWVGPATAPWWLADRIATMRLDPSGFVVEANDVAGEVIGARSEDLIGRHAADFIVPGSLSDEELRTILAEAGETNSVVRILGADGEVREIEQHCWRTAEGARYAFRPVHGWGQARLAAYRRGADGVTLVCEPAHDVAFAEFATQTLAWIPDPTPGRLAHRLHRIYPEASVAAEEATIWRVHRDRRDTTLAMGWWLDDSLTRVVWDEEALIVDANRHAAAYLGASQLVGRYWYEILVDTAGQDGARFRDLVRDLGEVESTWQLIGRDGRRREYDHHTHVEGELFVTVMRPHEV